MKPFQIPLWIQNMGAVTRTLILPLPAGIAQQRLHKAFDQTVIRKRGGLLLAGYKYQGRMNNTSLDVDITIYGRTMMFYKMHGEIMPHPKGIQLSITVKDMYPAISFLYVLMLVPFFAGTSMPPVMIAFFLPAFIFLLIAVSKWHRNVTADNISGLIRDVVCNPR